MTDVPAQLAQQHAPALKVGGRRLSTSTKPKPRSTGPTVPEEDPLQTVNPPPSPGYDDYPRPIGFGAERGHEHEHEHDRYQEESPKREKRGLVHEKDLKSQKMMEATQPSKEPGSKADFGRRINQPSKGLGLP